MPNTKTMLPIPVLILTLMFLPFVAIITMKLTTDAPPTDFGTGSMFDRIATRYDLINRVLALRMDVGWRQQMTQQVKSELGVTEGTNNEHLRLLDVATGTADVALQLAKDIPSSTILGVDPSDNMLNVGRRKVEQVELQERIELQTGDARDLSKYDANSFDGATMAFGIRNVPEREVALCEIHRLLKPSGVLAILEFSEPDDSHGPLGRVARLFIRHVLPFVGGILSGNFVEYLHLQNSIKHFPSPSDFNRLMQTLSCGENKNGHFEMEEVTHINYGSVQLYIGRAVKPDTNPVTNSETTE